MIVTEGTQHQSSMVPNHCNELAESDVYNSQTHLEILEGRKEATQNYNVFGSDRAERNHISKA